MDHACHSSWLWKRAAASSSPLPVMELPHRLLLSRNRIFKAPLQRRRPIASSDASPHRPRTIKGAQEHRLHTPLPFPTRVSPFLTPKCHPSKLVSPSPPFTTASPPYRLFTQGEPAGRFSTFRPSSRSHHGENLSPEPLTSTSFDELCPSRRRWSIVSNRPSPPTWSTWPWTRSTGFTMQNSSENSGKSSFYK
jgi:hypothetical protein